MINILKGISGFIIIAIVIALGFGIVRAVPVGKETPKQEKATPVQSETKEKTPARLDTQSGGKEEQTPREKEIWIYKLIHKLETSQDLWVKVEAVKKLGELKDPKVITALARALNDESVDICVEALRALKKIGDAESLKLLMTGTVIYDMQSLRFYALEAALAIDPVKTREFLKANFKSVFPNVRNNAAESLANLVTLTNKRDKESIEQLVSLLSHEPNKDNREKIAESLNLITQAELTSAEPKDWQEWWHKNKKTMSENIKTKEVITGTEKPETKPSPEKKAKAIKQKKAQDEFDAFKDKTILDRNPDDPTKSYFAGRSEEGKTLSVAAFANGDSRVLKLVEDALNWLQRHQEKEGFWDYNGYVKHCHSSPPGADISPAQGNPPEVGLPQAQGSKEKTASDKKKTASDKTDDTTEIKGDYDVAVTGLALLAFLGAGHTHMPGQKVGLPAGGKYKPTVERGLHWLVSNQNGDGSFRNPVTGGVGNKVNMFEQAMATLAISEAYGMTGDETLKVPAQKAMSFINYAKNPGKGWRYTPNCSDNDTSVVGWQVFALKSGKVSGLDINRNDFVDASKWLDDMTNLETARVGYNKKGTGSTAITSIGIICKMLLGWRNDSPILQKGAEIVLKDDSYQGETQDFYHIYQTSLAMFQMGGRYWENWNSQMTNFLGNAAVKEGCEHGSWSARIEKWSKSRVYTTALGALSLEIYYRYLPFARTEKSEQPM
ncbi:MAG: HEAT repeat domain-containing protein [Planctomycetota bacterium]